MLSEYINDYLKITGRPAATLTVDEYIKFINIENDVCATNNDSCLPIQSIRKNPEIKASESNHKANNGIESVKKGNALQMLKSVSG